MEKTTSPIAATSIPVVSIAESKLAEDTKTEAAEVDSTGKNMDPLEYFSRFLGIPEMVFNPFRSKELLTISEVCPYYYNFVASLKNFKEKIGIVLDENRMFEDLDLLKKSSRLYESIEVRRGIKLTLVSDMGVESLINMQTKPKEDNCYITKSELDFFYEKSYEWKKVLLTNINFRRKFDLWKLFSSIESSVESFYLMDSYSILPFENSTPEIDIFEALRFPKLKVLKLFFPFSPRVLSESYVRFLLNSVAIETLEFEGDIANRDILTEMLANFSKLKNLKIKLNHVTHMFKDESWKRFKFKLKSLLIFIDIDGRNIRNTNYQNFVKSQSCYLETLSIRIINDKEIFDTIMKMPKLKSLCLGNFYFPPDAIPNEISTTITELSWAGFVLARGLKFLLQAMPNVKRISLHASHGSACREKLQMFKSFKDKFQQPRFKYDKSFDRGCDMIEVDTKELGEYLTNNTF